MHHVRAAYCGGERYKILLPRGTAQPTSSQAEAHTDLMPTQQAYSEVKLLSSTQNNIYFYASRTQQACSDMKLLNLSQPDITWCPCPPIFGRKSPLLDSTQYILIPLPTHQVYLGVKLTFTTSFTYIRLTGIKHQL